MNALTPETLAHLRNQAELYSELHPDEATDWFIQVMPKDVLALLDALAEKDAEIERLKKRG